MWKSREIDYFMSRTIRYYVLYKMQNQINCISCKRILYENEPVNRETKYRILPNLLIRIYINFFNTSFSFKYPMISDKALKYRGKYKIITIFKLTVSKHKQKK